MEMKKAAAVCFIALFAATLVVLIARALDIQAASKIQPELQKIAAELETLRRQIAGGDVSLATGADLQVADGVAVYYVHGNTRCMTCETIESQAHEAVSTGFADELEDGTISWKMVNYEKPAGKHFQKDYGVQMPTVILVRMEDEKPGEWKRLDEVWSLYTDKPACVKFVQDEIRKMLNPDESVEDKKPEAEKTEADDDLPLPVVPLPESSTPEDAPLPLPMEN